MFSNNKNLLDFRVYKNCEITHRKCKHFLCCNSVFLLLPPNRFYHYETIRYGRSSYYLTTHPRKY